MPRKKRDPRYHYVYKTAVFQIHNPSKKKQRILRDALIRNHLAYSKLLPLTLAEFETLGQITAEGKYLTNKVRIDAVKKFIAPLVKPLPLGLAAKVGLQEDLANTIAAYLALQDDYKKRCAEEAEKPEDKRKEISEPGLPTFTRLTPYQKAHEEAYEELKNSLTLKDENQARDNILKENKSGLTRPILFLTNRISDGFLILYDNVKEKYLLYLNLHSKKSRFAESIDLGGLIDIRTSECFCEGKRNRTGALFPIKFAADFQLTEFMNRAKSASAKLMERHGHFEVHVSFEFKTRKIERQTYLGVDRGIYNLASMCVVDDIGHIIAEENFSGRNLRYVQQKEERRQRTTQKHGKKYKSATRLAEADKAVHQAANKIVELATEHKSQVVIEHLGNLTDRTSKRKRNNFNRLLARSQYTKLAMVLDYKLPLNGLPKPIAVAAPGTSQTCPECGKRNCKNREKKPLPDGKGFAMDRFLCIECGYEKDADLNAARVIALKKMWRVGLPKSQQAKEAKILSTTKHSFECCLTLWTEKRN